MVLVLLLFGSLVLYLDVIKKVNLFAFDKRLVQEQIRF